MRLGERRIAFDARDGAKFRELFDHPQFLALPPADRNALELEWAARLYQMEVEQPTCEQFFDGDLIRSLVAGASILDIGCYIGGKSVRFLECYGGRSIHGIDIEERYVLVASEFARLRGANATFSVAYAEHLPFDDGQFDVVVSENTFEHVQDIRKVLSECARVLKPSGSLIAIFPPFLGPISHHLDLVTRSPFLHWFFPYPALLKAYFALLDERGEEANWYRRHEREPLAHEKGYSINGTGAAEFSRLVADEWHLVADGFRSRARAKHPLKRLLQNAVKRTGLGFARELFPVALVLRRR